MPAEDRWIDLGDGTLLPAFVEGEPSVGTVVFAHGSGSSRHSRRNRHVAEVLQEAGAQTVLMDLLTEDEEAVDNRTRQHRFDIPLLSRRVVGVIDWLRPVGDSSPLGLFGASTGAAAALVAAAQRPDQVGAVVSRGGRPDLAGDALGAVKAPTLLIVGGLDRQVIELNQAARAQMLNEPSLEIIEGATHLFEEPGALDRVAELAAAWFSAHLGT